MLIKQSHLYFSDNSGAQKVKIFFKGKKKFINELSTARGSVKQAISDDSSLTGKKTRTVEEHSKVKVLILSTKKEKNRKNGTYVFFPETRGLLINDEKKIAKTIATNVFGVYPKELKKNRRYKIFAKTEKAIKQKNLSNQDFYCI